MRNINIDIIYDVEINAYTVFVDGEVLLECLSESEIAELTVSEIKSLAKAFA